MDENGIFYCATTHNQFYKYLVTNYAGRKIILWKVIKLTNLQAFNLFHKQYFDYLWFTRVLKPKNKIFLEILSYISVIMLNMKDV